MLIYYNLIVRYSIFICHLLYCYIDIWTHKSKTKDHGEDPMIRFPPPIGGDGGGH